MHYRLAFPSKYLCAADLQGTDRKVTIEKVFRDTLVDEKGGKEQAWVVRLAGKKKLWVLNVTNAGSISKWHGTEMDGWAGKQVTLYPTTCLAWGDEVECIRVREPGKHDRRRANAQAPAAESDSPYPPEEEVTAYEE